MRAGPRGPRHNQDMRLWAIVLLPVAALAQGPAVVFVNPAGDDTNSGLSTEQPWQSLARVQRALDEDMFTSGGEIRFARGGTWTGGLAVRSFSGPSLGLTAYG